ncbi:MAG: integration host factor [Gammaproteobacteria bacterium RIFCSPHIGHO2_12_FULL_40_19]|nr:MAG: integration host factor [Gammaproteobacteria bacterium RIFCSPHIGHO2_12_FULL_40_19]
MMAKTKTTKKTAKKAATRTTTKKLTAKTKTTTTAHKAAARKNASLKVTKPLKKAQLYSHLSECNGVSRKEISGVFEALCEVMESHLKKGGPGEFTVPGLMKCKVIRKPATKARKGVNPFTGEPTTFKAKPARNVIKVRPLKALKEMVN